MIRKYRKIKGYTQEQLAELLDITPRQLQRIENGKRGTSFKTFKNLVQVLEIKDEDIVKYIKQK